MANYQVKIPISVERQVIQIQNYISEVLFSPQAAAKRTQDILKGLRNLSAFPQRGFNADEKVGATIFPNQKTFGIPIVKGKYIILYSIDETNHIVEVYDLLPTQSDYAKLFL